MTSTKSEDVEALYDGPCEAGCTRFHGGELRHDKHCGHYPQSFTRLYDQACAERDALREALSFYAPDGDAWKDRMPEPPTQEEIDTFGGNIIDVGMPEILYDRGERARAALGTNQDEEAA